MTGKQWMAIVQKMINSSPDLDENKVICCHVAHIIKSSYHLRLYLSSCFSAQCS